MTFSCWIRGFFLLVGSLGCMFITVRTVQESKMFDEPNAMQMIFAEIYNCNYFWWIFMTYISIQMPRVVYLFKELKFFYGRWFRSLVTSFYRI